MSDNAPPEASEENCENGEHTSQSACDSLKPTHSTCSQQASGCYTWSCDTGYTQYENTCVNCTLTPSARECTQTINGKCGSPPYNVIHLCTKGILQASTSNSEQWNCQGTNNGTDATDCNVCLPDNYAFLKPCVDDTSKPANSHCYQIPTGETNAGCYTWRCDNGYQLNTTTNQCDEIPNTELVDGQCPSPPYDPTSLCVKGDPSVASSPIPSQWDCNGRNNGQNATNCNACPDGTYAFEALCDTGKPTHSTCQKETDATHAAHQCWVRTCNANRQLSSDGSSCVCPAGHQPNSDGSSCVLSTPPTPTPTVSPSVTPSVTPSATPSVTPTPVPAPECGTEAANTCKKGTLTICAGNSECPAAPHASIQWYCDNKLCLFTCRGHLRTTEAFCKEQLNAASCSKQSNGCYGVNITDTCHNHYRKIRSPFGNSYYCAKVCVSYITGHRAYNSDHIYHCSNSDRNADSQWADEDTRTTTDTTFSWQCKYTDAITQQAASRACAWTCISGMYTSKSICENNISNAKSCSKRYPTKPYSCWKLNECEAGYTKNGNSCVPLSTPVTPSVTPSVIPSVTPSVTPSGTPSASACTCGITAENTCDGTQCTVVPGSSTVSADNKKQFYSSGNLSNRYAQYTSTIYKWSCTNGSFTEAGCAFASTTCIGGYQGTLSTLAADAGFDGCTSANNADLANHGKSCTAKGAFYCSSSTCQSVNYINSGTHTCNFVGYCDKASTSNTCTDDSCTLKKCLAGGGIEDVQ